MRNESHTILLVQPWLEDFYYTDCRIQPIGLAYLSASLRRRFPGIRVILYDALAGGEKRTIPWPEEFGYLKPYYGFPDKSPDRLFHQYYRFGKSPERMEQELSGLHPLLVGVSSLFTPYYRQSLAAAGLCKKLFPQSPVVMGGSHATMHPASLLEAEADGRPLCDYVLRGESEVSLGELLEALLGKREFSNVSNLVVRETARGPFADLISPEFENIPEPDFSGLNSGDYTLRGKNLSFLITGRSCPHRCNFCSIHSVFGKKFRQRSPVSVIAEIKKRHAEGIRHIDIEDDNFTARKNNARKILQGIIDLNLPLTFSAMNGLSYHSLDDELLLLLKKAGFVGLNLSLVDARQRSLDLSGRPHAVEKFFSVVREAAKIDLPVTAYYISGLPGQTVEEMCETLRLLSAEQCLIGASPFYFTPGSPVHMEKKKDPNIILASLGRDSLFSARLTALDVETVDFDRDDVYTLFRLTRLINHAKAGIDANLNPDDRHFGHIHEFMKHGRWFFENGGRRVPAPFSRRVWNEFRERGLVIRGHRVAGPVLKLES